MVKRFKQMVTKKNNILLSLFLIFNYNCETMETTTCFNTDKFSMLTTLIEEKGTTIKLQERLVADKKTVAKEISLGDSYVILLAETNTIVVIDKKGTIPSYTCYIEEKQLMFSAYEARFDIEMDIDKRKEHWCQLITSVLPKED